MYHHEYEIILEAPIDEVEFHMALLKCTKELPIPNVVELPYQPFNYR